MKVVGLTRAFPYGKLNDRFETLAYLNNVIEAHCYILNQAFLVVVVASS